MTSCRGEGYNPPRRMIYYKRRMIYYNELRRRTWQSVREEEDNNIIQAEEEGTTIGNRRVRQYAEDDRGRHRTASLRQQLQHGAMRVLPWQRVGGINHYAEDWPRVRKYQGGGYGYCYAVSFYYCCFGTSIKIGEYLYPHTPDC